MGIKAPERATITAVVCKVDTPSFSGLVYPADEMQAAIDRINLEHAGRILGQVGMPEGHADLAKMSHVVGNLRIIGTDVLGEVVFMATPAGIEAAKMYEESQKSFAFRSCGIGKLRNQEISDYRILSINMVPNDD